MCKIAEKKMWTWEQLKDGRPAKPAWEERCRAKSTHQHVKHEMISQQDSNRLSLIGKLWLNALQILH